MKTTPQDWPGDTSGRSGFTGWDESDHLATGSEEVESSWPLPDTMFQHRDEPDIAVTRARVEEAIQLACLEEWGMSVEEARAAGKFDAPKEMVGNRK